MVQVKLRFLYLETPLRQGLKDDEVKNLQNAIEF